MMAWKDRFERARNRKVFFGLVSRPGFTREDKIMVASWNTCAVGEAIHVAELNIPIEWDESITTGNIESFPVDAVLEDLGIQFSNAVYYDRIDKAEMLYHAIMRRCRKLDARATRAYIERQADAVINEVLSKKE